MVVVAIVGILASVAIPAYFESVLKGRRAGRERRLPICCNSRSAI